MLNIFIFNIYFNFFIVNVCLIATYLNKYK